ncbi:MAG: phosphatase PAP2 family protein [Bacteroidota bacterium]
MKIITTLLLTFCIWTNTHAQEIQYADTARISDILSKDFSCAGQDLTEVFKSAITPTWEKAAVISGLTVGTIALIQWDDDFRLSAQKGVSSDLNTASRAVKFYGEKYVVVGISGGLYLSGLAFKNDDVRTAGRLTLEALVVSGVIGGSLKVIIGRSRPRIHEGPRKFNFWEWDNARQSLPSGHTTNAFTVSAVLAEQIDTWWARVGLYSLAAATSYSRVYDDEHWTSDIFLGAAIGYLSGKTIVEINRDHKSQEIINSLKDRVLLYPVSDGIGVTVKF